MRKTTLSLVIGTLVASGAACAGEDYGTEKDINAEGSFGAGTELSVDNIEQVGASSAFAQLDADGDGEVSELEAEAMTGLEAELARLDSDGDGALSFDEFAALSANTDLDSNAWGDQSAMNPRELDSPDLALGGEVDATADTALGAAGVDTEIGADVETESELGLDRDIGMESEGSVALQVEEITESNVETTFETVDVNGDDAVDSTEATSITGLANVFAQLDANGDGELDYTEFKAVTSLTAGFGADQS